MKREIDSGCEKMGANEMSKRLDKYYEKTCEKLGVTIEELERIDYDEVDKRIGVHDIKWMTKRFGLPKSMYYRILSPKDREKRHKASERLLNSL